MSTRYTLELKITRTADPVIEKDRYGTGTVKEPGGETRLGHLTLTGADLTDLKERAGRALDEVQDW